MAYGQNRSQVASDSFPSSIDANWTDGPGPSDVYVWVAAGDVEPQFISTHSLEKRTGEAYANDQYSVITIGNMSDGSMAAAARMQSLGGCYMGYISTASDVYRVSEMDDNTTTINTLASLADPGTEIPLSAGETLTIECEGTELRCGSNGGGSDVEKVNTTDATYSAGDPGFWGFNPTSTDGSSVSAWEGGDISASLSSAGLRPQAVL